MEQNDFIKIIKVSDRTHNLSELPLTKDPDRIARYKEDTIKYIIPLGSLYKRQNIKDLGRNGNRNGNKIIKDFICLWFFVCHVGADSISALFFLANEILMEWTKGALNKSMFLLNK